LFPEGEICGFRENRERFPRKLPMPTPAINTTVRNRGMYKENRLFISSN